MRKARIHIYFSTITLPNRKLSDVEQAHDVIDIDIGPNERVVQVDLVEGAVYNKAYAPPSGDPQMHELVPETMFGRKVTVRNRSLSTFRARVATIEEIDAVNEEEFLLSLPEGSTEAEIVDGIQTD
jgi:hypothetical protein